MSEVAKGIDFHISTFQGPRDPTSPVETTRHAQTITRGMSSIDRSVSLLSLFQSELVSSDALNSDLWHFATLAEAGA